MRFSLRTALVVGASRGIGLATARRFASEGAKVLIAARNRDDGEAAAENLREQGFDVSFAAVDIGDSEQLHARSMRRLSSGSAASISRCSPPGSPASR